MWYQRSVVLGASEPRVRIFVDNPLFNVPFVRGKLTAIVVVAKYLWLLVWPLRLSCDYSYNQIPIASGTLYDWIAWIVVAAVILGVASAFKWSHVAFFCAGFALLTFVPVSNLLFLTGTIMAERFLYLPAIGFAGCLVLTTYWIGGRIHSRAFAPIALFLVIIGFGVRTWERNFDWHDDLALWTSAMRVAPGSFKVYADLAYALNASDPNHLMIDQVIADEERSLAILDPLPNPFNIAYVYDNAGHEYDTKGQFLLHQEPNGSMTVTPESLRAYQRATEILLRGVAVDRALYESHRKAELARGMAASEIVAVGRPTLYFALAIAYLQQGKNQDAYEAAAYSRLLSPQYADAYVAMGAALFSQNRKEDAAINWFEGLLITGDQKFLPLLQHAYNCGPDTKGCPFIQTGDGLSLNTSSPIVHNDICKASSDLTKILIQGHEQALADETKNKALVNFGCSLIELQSPGPPCSSRTGERGILNFHSNTFPQLPANYLLLGTIIVLINIHQPRYPKPQTWTFRSKQ